MGLLESLPDHTSAEDEVSYQAVGRIKGYRAEYTPSSPTGPLPSWRSEELTDRHWARGITSPTWEIKAGTVEAHVCTRCGYLERRVQDPGWVPYQRLAGFTWVNPPSDTGEPE